MPVSAEGRVENQTEPKRPHSAAVWVRFGFQLNSIEKKCSGLRGKPCTGVSRKKPQGVGFCFLLASNYERERKIPTFSQKRQKTMSHPEKKKSVCVWT